LLEALRLRSSLKALLPATLQHAATAIAIVAIDTDGLITYINRPGMELVQEFTGQARLRKNLIGQNLAKVLNRGLPLTIIGRTLQTGKEVNGQLLSFGKSLYTVTTRILRDNGSVIGCVEYAIKARKSEHKENLLVSQAFARHLADRLGYHPTDWIDDISYNHAQLLIRCLCQNDHAIELAEYCPYKFECAFSPEHGHLALDRRNYRRVKIELPVELHLLKLGRGLPVPEEIQKKRVPGTTIDLSVKGAQIRCPVRLPLNSTVQLSLKEVDRAIICTGEVVWQRQDDDGHWFTGLRFEEIAGKDSSAIIALLTRQEVKVRRSSTA